MMIYEDVAKASIGVDGKMFYASSLGMSPSDVLGMSYLESNLGLSIDKWVHPLISSNTQGSLGDEGGRPTNESQGKGLQETGEQTKESDQNTHEVLSEESCDVRTWAVCLCW